MSDVQISVQNLSKSYETYDPGKAGAGSISFRQLLGLKPKSSADEKLFWALRDVSFDIKRGERVGIIGSNGAGKSTLLKILSRIIYPTKGEAEIRGRVSSLLELGAGFREELSGRDNIFLNASLSGLSRDEINAKFDDMVAFSGIGKFIDFPIKHLSSGMRVRLAFAVAVHVDPDVLMLDEILAVGDIAFQQKCLNRMSSLTSEKRTLLFVSHSLGDVARFCDRVIWLENGRVKFDGDAITGLNMYQSQMLGTSIQSNNDLTNFRGERKGTGLARFEKVRTLNDRLTPIHAIHTGQSIAIEFTYRAKEQLPREIFELSATASFENHKKQRLFTTPSEILVEKIGDIGEQGKLICRLPKFPLVPGVYTMTASLHINRQMVDKVVDCLTINVFDGDFYGTGRLPVAVTGEVCVPFSWSHQAIEADDASDTAFIEQRAASDAP